jgi:hypothetical protein
LSSFGGALRVDGLKIIQTEPNGYRTVTVRCCKRPTFGEDGIAVGRAAMIVIARA